MSTQRERSPFDDPRLYLVSRESHLPRNYFDRERRVNLLLGVGAAFVLAVTLGCAAVLLLVP